MQTYQFMSFRTVEGWSYPQWAWAPLVQLEGKNFISSHSCTEVQWAGSQGHTPSGVAWPAQRWDRL